jgi:hypothetical protein
MTQQYRGFDLNQPGTQAPWGKVELDNFKQLIDTALDSGSNPWISVYNGPWINSIPSAGIMTYGATDENKPIGAALVRVTTSKGQILGVCNPNVEFSKFGFPNDDMSNTLLSTTFSVPGDNVISSFGYVANDLDKANNNVYFAIEKSGEITEDINIEILTSSQVVFTVISPPAEYTEMNGIVVVGTGSSKPASFSSVKESESPVGRLLDGEGAEELNSLIKDGKDVIYVSPLSAISNSTVTIPRGRDIKIVSGDNATTIWSNFGNISFEIEDGVGYAGSLQISHFDLNTGTLTFDDEYSVVSIERLSGSGTVKFANNSLFNNLSLGRVTGDFTFETNAVRYESHEFGTFNIAGGATDLPKLEAWSERSLSADKVQKVKGYDNPSNYVTSYNGATGLATITPKTGGRVNFFGGGKQLSFETGDTRLSVQLPATKRKYLLYHNKFSGALSFETVTTSDSVLRENTLGAIINLDDDPLNPGLMIENSIIERVLNCETDPVANYASSKTEGVREAIPVRLIGVLGGSTIGHTAGEYVTKRKYAFPVPAKDESVIIWPRYFFNGLDADGNFLDRNLDLADFGVPYLSVGGALQYNFWNGSSFELVDVDEGKFVAVHVSVAHNDTVQITSKLGTGQYLSLVTAQNSLVSERRDLVRDQVLISEVKIFASMIFKNVAGVGELQYADSEDNLFSYVIPEEGATGGGSAVTQNLDTTWKQGPNPGVVDFSGYNAADIVSVHIKDGENQAVWFGSGKLCIIQAEIESVFAAFADVGTIHVTLLEAQNVKIASPTLSGASLNIGAGDPTPEEYTVDDSKPNGFSGRFFEDIAVGALFPAQPEYKTWLLSGTNKRLRPIASFDGGDVHAYALTDEVTPLKYSVFHQVNQNPYYQRVPDPDNITEASGYQGTGINDSFNADVVYVPEQIGESLHSEGVIAVDHPGNISMFTGDTVTSRANTPIGNRIVAKNSVGQEHYFDTAFDASTLQIGLTHGNNTADMPLTSGNINDSDFMITGNSLARLPFSTVEKIENSIHGDTLVTKDVLSQYWIRWYKGDGSDLPLDGSRRWLFEGVTGTAFGGLIRVSSNNQQVVLSLSVNADTYSSSTLDYNYAGGIERSEISVLSFTQQNGSINDFPVLTLTGKAGSKKYFGLSLPNSAEITVEVLAGYNIQRTSISEIPLGYLSKNVDVPTITPALNGNYMNTAEINDKIIVNGEFTGATTTDTAEQNHALGNQGLVSWGALGTTSETALGLMNDWVEFNTVDSPRYFVSKTNYLTITGLIKDGDQTDGVTIAQMPASLRPPRTVSRVAYASADGVSRVTVGLYVEPGGDVRLFSMPSGAVANNFVRIDTGYQLD